MIERRADIETPQTTLEALDGLIVIDEIQRRPVDIWVGPPWN